LAAPASRRFLHSLYLINQELSEEVYEFVVRIERKNIGDVLVGTHKAPFARSTPRKTKMSGPFLTSGVKAFS
jgi:hypothetical protein